MGIPIDHKWHDTPFLGEIMDLPRILCALQLMKPFEGDHDLQRAQAIPSLGIRMSWCKAMC